MNDTSNDSSNDTSIRDGDIAPQLASSVSPAVFGHWQMPAGEYNALLTGAALSPLKQLGVIAVQGDDAKRFLHRQLTNDVEHLPAGRLQLNGLCSAKGRLLAMFEHGCTEDATLLQLPSELLPGIVKRLGMYVMRAKVTIIDASRQWQALGLTGPEAQAALAHAGVALPHEIGGGAAVPGGWWFRMHPSPQAGMRAMLLAAPEVVADWQERLVGCTITSEATWWWSAIDAAVPAIGLGLQERFVPQMVNFEVLGGVDFKKGCYPGQEVVARSQYLGKLRRRMGVGHCSALAPLPGTEIFASRLRMGKGAVTGSVGASETPVAFANDPVGIVVMSCGAPDGGCDFLFEGPTEALQAAPALHLGSPTGPIIAMRALPYPLRDVTA